MNLEIGGERKRDGWVVLNAGAEYNVDIIAAVPPLPKYVTERQWDEIEAIHLVEHVYLWQAVELVKQVYWCLAPGGRFSVELPDISYCARVFLGLMDPPRGASGQFDMWGFYGDPNHKNPLYMHKWGYTPKTLTDLFVESGFKRELVFMAQAQSH